MLNIGENRVEIYECDEQQHNHILEICESARMSEIYDEPGISGKQTIFIRWNPHSFKPPGKYSNKLLKPKPAARKELMISLIKKIRANPPKDIIHIYYMFYSEDNATITKEYPKTMIWCEADIASLV